MQKEKTKHSHISVSYTHLDVYKRQTLDITFILMSVIFVGGLSGTLIKKCLKIIIPIIIPLGFLFIWYIQTPNQVLLHDYQVTRIMTFLEPSKYSSTTAYQQDNSVMAIGSGKLYGKGLNNNTIADVTVSDTGFVSDVYKRQS